MNPFEFQAEFARQWLGMATAGMSAFNNLARQGIDTWSRAAGIAHAPAPAPAPAFMTPFDFWRSLLQPSAGSTLPFAQFNPFMAMFGQQQPQPAFPMMPWLNPGMWSTASPVAFWQMKPTLPGWPMFAGAFFPWSGFKAPSANPSADLLDQVASTYRTASGYATAAIATPFGPLDPRTYGEPWWQAYTKKRLN